MLSISEKVKVMLTLSTIESIEGSRGTASVIKLGT
jgi:hypothetical protein